MRTSSLKESLCINTTLDYGLETQVSFHPTFAYIIVSKKEKVNSLNKIFQGVYMKKDEFLKKNNLRIRKVTKKDLESARTDYQRTSNYIIKTKSGDEYFSKNGSVADCKAIIKFDTTKQAVKTYNRMPKGWKEDRGASNPKGAKWINNGKSRFAKDNNGKRIFKQALLITDKKLFNEKSKSYYCK